MRFLILLLAILLSTNIACNQAKEKEGDDKNVEANDDSKSSKQTVNQNSPTAVANQVLAAIQAADPAAIKPLLLLKSEEQLTDEQLTMFLKGDQGTVAGVTEVTEVRRGFKANEVLAKIRVAGDKVFVVVLTRTGASYWFTDLTSRPLVDYESQKKIEP